MSINGVIKDVTPADAGVALTAIELTDRVVSGSLHGFADNLPSVAPTSSAVSVHPPTEVKLQIAPQSVLKNKRKRIQFEEEDLVIEDVLDQEEERKKGNRFRSKWLAIVSLKGKPDQRWYCKGLLKSDLKRMLEEGKIKEGELRSKLEKLIHASDEAKDSRTEEGEVLHEKNAEQEVYATQKVHRYLPRLQPEARYVSLVSRKGALVLSKEVVGFRRFNSILTSDTALLAQLRKGEVPGLGQLMIYSQGVNEIDLNARGIGVVEEKAGVFEAARIDFGNCMGDRPEDFEDTQDACLDFTKTADSIIAMPWLTDDKEQADKRPNEPGYKKGYRAFAWLDTHLKGKSLPSRLFDRVACAKSEVLLNEKYLAILNIILTPNKFIDRDAEAYEYSSDYQHKDGSLDIGFASIDKRNKMEYRAMLQKLPGFKEFFLSQVRVVSTGARSYHKFVFSLGPRCKNE